MAILVFARMDSERLPGKLLADIGGRPLLGRVLDRVQRARCCSRIIVATSARAIDEPIASFAGGEGVEVFRGDGTDVAARALACCEQSSLNSFVRISGDSPFMPPELIDRVAEAAQNESWDIVTNVHPRTWPAGASVELISVNALSKAYSGMTPDDREHLTTRFYRSPESWRIVNVPATEGGLNSVRLTVDTPEELERVRGIISSLDVKPEEAPLGDIVAAVRSMQNAA